MRDSAVSGEGAESSTAAQLIDGLLADAEIVDEGSFSLDTAAAAEKLEAFQFADRAAYLVPIAEAAIALGAKQISLTTHGPDLEIEFGPVELGDPLRFLADPFARRQSDADPRAGALGRLAVGLNMARGHDSIIRVVVQHEELTAEYRRGEAPRVVRRPTAAGDGRLRIIIDRPRSLLGFARATAAELTRLEDAVRHAKVDVLVDGELISHHSRDWDFRRDGEGPGYRFEAGFQCEGEEDSVIEVWVGGVCVERLPSMGLAFAAALHLDHPTRDLSQLRIVRDSTVEAALTEIEAARTGTLADLAAADEGREQQGKHSRWDPPHWPRERVDRVLERAVRGPPPHEKPGPKLAERASGLMTGVLFYGAGTIAGIIGFWFVFGGNLAGLIGVLLLVTHGGIGAKHIGKALAPPGYSGLYIGVILFVVAVIFAVTVGSWQ